MTTLKKYIAKHGPQSLSALGSKVSAGKPPNIKLKTFIKEHSSVFKMGGDGMVSLV